MTEKAWYRGNLHTHTTESDGDADPEAAVEWYRDHGYDFLVLSDHNHRTILDRKLEGGPLMIPGEEVSAQILGGKVPIHVNGIGISRVVEPIDAGSVTETLQANVNAILDAGGIAQFNHPNAGWAFDHEDILQVTGASLLEVYNGWPGANSEGGPGKFSAEEIWDEVLSAGRVIFGVATDDAHHYSDFTHNRANPGRGWVMVRAPELTSKSIVEALTAGEFYFSTGVDLDEIEVSQDRFRVGIRQHRDYVYRTRFIGKDGRLLDECKGLEPAYMPEGDEGYIRATVQSSYGTKAWTQPSYLLRIPQPPRAGPAT